RAELQIPGPRGRLGQARRCQRGKREDRRREAIVVRRSAIALEEIGGQYLDVVTGLRRQRWAARRGVAPRVDRGVRDALEELVHADAAFLALDAGGGKIEVVELRHPTGAVDRHVDFEPSYRPPLGGADREPNAVPRDAVDLGV